MLCPVVMEKFESSAPFDTVMEKPPRSGCKLSVSVIEQHSASSQASDRECSVSFVVAMASSLCEEQIPTHATSSHTKQIGRSLQTPHVKTSFIATEYSSPARQKASSESLAIYVCFPQWAPR